VGSRRRDGKNRTGNQLQSDQAIEGKSKRNTRNIGGWGDAHAVTSALMVMAKEAIVNQETRASADRRRDLLQHSSTEPEI
jgi:hypothetical protein